MPCDHCGFTACAVLTDMRGTAFLCLPAVTDYLRTAILVGYRGYLRLAASDDAHNELLTHAFAPAERVKRPFF